MDNNSYTEQSEGFIVLFKRMAPLLVLITIALSLWAFFEANSENPQKIEKIEIEVGEDD